MQFRHLAAVPAAALAFSALAQVPTTNMASGDGAATSDGVPGILIPAKTVVHIVITQTVSSQFNKIGDTFSLKLATPLTIEEHTVLPSGISGRGEVTHAAKRGWGGRAGELIVNARYLECGNLRIPLGHFHHETVGTSNVGGAFATAQVVPFGQFMVSGQDAVIPAGAGGTAQINADVTIPPGIRCAPVSQ